MTFEQYIMGIDADLNKLYPDKHWVIVAHEEKPGDLYCSVNNITEKMVKTVLYVYGGKDEKLQKKT